MLDEPVRHHNKMLGVEEVEKPVPDSVLLDPEFVDAIAKQVRMWPAEPMTCHCQAFDRHQALDPYRLWNLLKPVSQRDSSRELPVEHHVRHASPAWWSLANLRSYPKPSDKSTHELPARGLGLR